MPAICGLRSIILLKCSLAKKPKLLSYVTIGKSLYFCMTVDEEFECRRTSKFHTSPSSLVSTLYPLEISSTFQCLTSCLAEDEFSSYCPSAPSTWFADKLYIEALQSSQCNFF